MKNVISVVIPTRDSGAGLSATLACLVGAAIDGLVKEVVVADGGSTDDTLEIAEDAGARIVRSQDGEGEQLRLGCAAARGEWLLVLAPGARLSDGWEREVADHLAGGPDRAGVFGLDPGGSPLALLGRSIRALAGPPGLERGLLVSRALYEDIGGFRNGEAADVDLARRLGRARLRTLNARLTERR